MKATNDVNREDLPEARVNPPTRDRNLNKNPWFIRDWEELPGGWD